MADVPQDPRQLARDILSGKVKIEDLAREQQRRRAAAAAAGGIKGAGGQQKRTPLVIQPAPPMQRPVARQPLPPPSRPQPFQRPQPPVPMQRRTPQFPFTQQRRPSVPARAPQPTPNRPLPPVKPVLSSLKPDDSASQAYAAPASIQDAAQGPIGNPQLDLRKLVRHRTALRQCILMAEVLGKPVSLREDW